MTAHEPPVIVVDLPLPDADPTSESAGPQSVNWQPEWVVDVGHGCEVGLTTDDGCFLVLYPQPDGSWRSGTHIPRQAAERIEGGCSGAVRRRRASGGPGPRAGRDGCEPSNHRS